MDARLRLLLKEFLTTNDPIDAASYARAASRATGNLSDPVVYVYHRLDQEERDDIALFLTSRRAYRHAAREAKKLMDDSRPRRVWA